MTIKDKKWLNFYGESQAYKMILRMGSSFFVWWWVSITCAVWIIAGIRHPPKHQSRHYLAKLETVAANFPFTCHFLLLKIMISFCDRKCKFLFIKTENIYKVNDFNIKVFVFSQMSMTYYQIVQYIELFYLFSPLIIIEQLHIPK